MTQQLWCMDVVRKNLVSSSVLNNCGYKQVIESDKFVLSKHDEALDKFKVFKIEVELQQKALIKRFRTDKGGEYMDTLYFQSISIIHETTAPYTPQQNVISERKNKVPKEMFNSMLSYSGLSQGFWGEAMLTSYYLLKKKFHVVLFRVDEPKEFDEAMKSQDVAFWKEAINDQMDFIMGNNTWVLANLPHGCKPPGCKWIFKRKLKVDGTIKKFKTRLVIQGFRQKQGIDYCDTYALVACISTIRLLIVLPSIHNLIIHQIDVKTAFLNVSTPIDTSEKPRPNNGEAVSQLEYSRVIGCLMYIMTCTRHDIDFAVGKLSRYTSNPSTKHLQAIQRVLKYLKKTMDYSLTFTGYPLVLEGYTDASWISNIEYNSSTSGSVFLVGGGVISWASKKQTCITSSTMKYEFVALAATTTLAKAYSQMYNWKSRHLGVKHIMIRVLIMNGVVFIEFVRSQQNLADHLMKGLAKNLVLKSAKGMCLKSNLVTKDNSQVKDNKIDLLVQQYEQFVISEYESTYSAFARFNTIITSLKALDEGYSSKNYVREFLRALHPKWRAKVMAIEETKDLTSLLDELIGNLKVYELIIKKDSEIVKGKGERISLALKAKNESSDEESSTFESEDEEYATAGRLETSRSSSREESDSNDEDDEKAKDKTCLMTQASSEIFLRNDLEPDEWIKDSGCTKHMTGNSNLFSSYKAYNRGNVIFGSKLRGNIIGKGTISHDSLNIANVELVDNLGFNLLSVS
ncbi:zinc finger, CCHC-type containing protein [Tanacetum coccineum]